MTITLKTLLQSEKSRFSHGQCIVTKIRFGLCLVFIFIYRLGICQDVSYPDLADVKNLIQSGMPESGEIIVKKTLLNALGDFPPKPIGVDTSNYRAIWRDDDFLLQELTPESSGTTNAVTGLLIGENAEFDWFVQARELSVFAKHQDGRNDTGNDGNMVTYYVGFGRSTVRSFFGGADFEDVNWSGNHLKATVAGTPIEADLEYENKRPVLEGKSDEKGVTGNFRIEYLDWKEFDGKQFSQHNKFYTKFSGDADYSLQAETWINKLETPYENTNLLCFTPGLYINTNYFSTLAYISNKVFLVYPNGGMAEVRNIPVPMPATQPPKFFVVLVLFLSLLFACFLLIFRFRRQPTKSVK